MCQPAEKIPHVFLKREPSYVCAGCPRMSSKGSVSGTTPRGTPFALPNARLSLTHVHSYSNRRCVQPRTRFKIQGSREGEYDNSKPAKTGAQTCARISRTRVRIGLPDRHNTGPKGSCTVISFDSSYSHGLAQTKSSSMERRLTFYPTWMVFHS